MKKLRSKLKKIFFKLFLNENFTKKLKVCLLQVIKTCPILYCESIKKIAQKI